MNKRAAMTLAAGLVAALLVGAAGLSLGLPDDTARAGGDTVAPRVRTIERTRTVHRRSSAGQGSDRTVIVPSAPAVSGLPADASVPDEPLEDEWFGDDREDEGDEDDRWDHDEGEREGEHEDEGGSDDD